MVIMKHSKRIQKFQLRFLYEQRYKICSIVAENVECKGVYSLTQLTKFSATVKENL